jgi:hypothetical protein
MEREIRREGDRANEMSAERQAAEAVAAGSLVEAIGGIAAILLAILGLLGLVDDTLASIGVIVLGAAMLFEGTAILSRYSRLTRYAGGGSELTGGVTLEFIGGLSVLVLGVLALLTIATMTLLSIGVIAYGVTLILSAGTRTRLNAIESSNQPYESHQSHLMSEAVMGSTALQMLAGIGGVVLGILALIGIHGLTLILIAILGLGSAILLAGSALSSRMLGVMRG